MMPETAEKRTNCLNDTICGLGVVQGDVLVDFNEVFTDVWVLLQSFRHELGRLCGGLLV